jgi:hypothetical protein
MIHGWTRSTLSACPIAAGVAVVLSGCTAFDDHRESLELLHAQGRYEQAAALLDNPRTRELYSSDSDVLWKLDRGAVALALGDDDTCITVLEQAEKEIELRRERSLADQLVSWTVNDRSVAYLAEPYEDVYVNVIKLLAQLRAGRISGGATVEARRLGSKADMLRDAYLKYEDALDTRAAGLGQARGVVAVNNAGDFIESTLGTYLSAVTFMKSGDREFQRVAGRRLQDSIRLQRGLIGPVHEEDFAGLSEAAPDSINLLVVALSGRGPTKFADRVGPIPLGTFPVYFELPQLRTYPTRVDRARVEVREPGQTEPTGRYLSLVEDLSAVAVENHRRMLPIIYTRTLIRYAVKAGLMTAGTELARRKAKDRNQELVQVAGAVAGLAFLMATERADLRCWVFLPGQARVAAFPVPAGPHEVRVIYESAGAAVYATPWRQVRVDAGAGALTTVVTQYWD